MAILSLKELLLVDGLSNSIDTSNSYSPSSRNDIVKAEKGMNASDEGEGTRVSLLKEFIT